MTQFARASFLQLMAPMSILQQKMPLAVHAHTVSSMTNHTSPPVLMATPTADSFDKDKKDDESNDSDVGKGSKIRGVTVCPSFLAKQEGFNS